MPRFKDSVCEFKAHNRYYVQDMTDYHWIPGIESIWYAMPNDDGKEYCAELYHRTGYAEVNGGYHCFVVDSDFGDGPYAMVFHASKQVDDDAFEALIGGGNDDDEGDSDHD